MKYTDREIGDSMDRLLLLFTAQVDLSNAFSFSFSASHSRNLIISRNNFVYLSNCYRTSYNTIDKLGDFDNIISITTVP